MKPNNLTPDYIECKQKETKMGIEDPGTIRRYNNIIKMSRLFAVK